MIINIRLKDMRKLATALGCLVIAAYATIGQATENHDMGSNLIAKCHFGDNGYVIFRQRPDDRDHIRANQHDPKKIGGTKRPSRKLMMQQGADSDGEEHPEEDELEEEVDAEVDEGGVQVETRKKPARYEASESEDEELEGEISAEDCEETDEKVRKAEAEASEKKGKKVNISCTYTEDQHEEANAKAKSLAKDKKSKRNRSLSAEGRFKRSRSESASGSVERRRKSPKERSCSASPE